MPNVPAKVYDTIAEMKQDILCFKADLRADYDALQKELDECNAMLSHSIISCDKQEKLLAKHTSKISSLESDIVILKNDNNQLRAALNESCAQIKIVVTRLGGCETSSSTKFRQFDANLHSLVDICNEEIDHRKALATMVQSQKYITDEIKNQIQQITEPRQSSTSALKSELKRVREQVKSQNDDLINSNSALTSMQKEIKEVLNHR